MPSVLNVSRSPKVLQRLHVASGRVANDAPGHTVVHRDLEPREAEDDVVRVARTPNLAAT